MSNTKIKNQALKVKMTVENAKIVFFCFESENSL